MSYFFENTDFVCCPNAGVTGNGWMWQRKPPDAESTVGAESAMHMPEKFRTHPAYAVSGSI
jgi:hypothetical protein